MYMRISTGTSISSPVGCISFFAYRSINQFVLTSFHFQDIEIEKNKEEVLLSNQWGSFFVHDNATRNGFISNACTMEGKPICEKKPVRREMNTYWGDLIQKYSTLAIPRIDFITGKLISCTFKLFITMQY